MRLPNSLELHLGQTRRSALPAIPWNSGVSCDPERQDQFGCRTLIEDLRRQPSCRSIDAELSDCFRTVARDGEMECRISRCGVFLRARLEFEQACYERSDRGSGLSARHCYTGHFWAATMSCRVAVNKGYATGGRCPMGIGES